MPAKASSDCYRGRRDLLQRLFELIKGRFAFFTPVVLITDLLRNDPAFQQADGSKEPILPFVLSSLKSNPQISAVYAGYENGNYFQVLSISGSEKEFVALPGGPPLTRYAFQARRQQWRTSRDLEISR